MCKEETKKRWKVEVEENSITFFGENGECIGWINTMKDGKPSITLYARGFYDITIYP